MKTERNLLVLAAWGQAAKTHLQKLLVLQKRVLRLMYFSEPRAHAVLLFMTSNILPVNMLYVETVSSLMYDVSCLSVPSNISELVTKVNEIHTHKTRSSSSDNFYRKIHCLTSEFHVKFHAKNHYRTNREAMSAISVFQVKFNVEFTRQAVNFS